MIDQDDVETPALREPGFAWIDRDVIDLYFDRMSPTTCKVYVFLCRWAMTNQERSVLRSVAAIANGTSLSEPTVRAATNELQRLGLIAVEKRYSDNQQLSNAYHVNPIRWIMGSKEHNGTLVKETGERWSKEHNTEIKKLRKETTNEAKSASYAGNSSNEEQQQLQLRQEGPARPHVASSTDPVAIALEVLGLKKLRPQQEAAIREQVGDALRWRAVLMEWMIGGHNPTNLLGILGVYRDGWRQRGVKEQERIDPKRKRVHIKKPDGTWISEYADE